MFKYTNILSSGILRETVVYAFFNATTAFLPVFLLPILTRYLSPADYGILSIFAILVFLFGPLIRLELQTALRRFYHDSTQDFTAEVGNAIAISLVMLLALVLIWVIARFFVSDILEVPIDWVLGAIIVSFGAAMTGYLMSLYQMQGNALQVGIRSLTMAVLIFVPTVMLVVWFHFHWTGRTWTQLFVALFFEIPTAFYLIHRMFPFRLNLDRTRAKNLLQFSLPLVPTSIASYFLMTTDRILLGQYLSLSEVGLFTVAVQIVSAMRLVMNSFVSSWEIWLFKNLNEGSERRRRRVVIVFYMFTALLLLCALGVIFVLPLILPWFVGAKFQDAYKFVAWLAFAEMFKALSICIQTFFLYIKKTVIFNYVLIAQAAINFGVLILFIRTNGAVGASQATLLSAILGFVIAFGLVNYYFKLPWIDFWREFNPWMTERSARG